MRLAFLQSSGFFCRIAQIIQILVIQFLVCKALTHFLMIVFFPDADFTRIIERLRTFWGGKARPFVVPKQRIRVQLVSHYLKR